MPVLVKKSHLFGEIEIPSSKSQTHRALLFGSLAKTKSIIRKPLDSSDTRAMVKACRYLGASIHHHSDHVEIQGIGGKVVGAQDIINANNSGIILRFISAVAALGSQSIVITGDHSIRHQRPIQTMLNSLNQLGAYAISTCDNGFAPIIVRGPLKPGRCVIADGSDSQNVSSLLIAAAFIQGTVELEVNTPGEKPWVDLTLDWLKRLEISYENHHHKKYIIQGREAYDGFEYTVSGDWSSAAYPITAALITQSCLTIKNVDIEDIQGDKKIVDIFSNMGAQFTIDSANRTFHVAPGKHFKGITVDINDCIDAITILAVAGCFAEGETCLMNAAVARQKECDRIRCIATELGKMGANIQETPDGLMIRKSALKGAQVSANGDHRMAMSLAVAAMGAKGSTDIHDTSNILKTYPNFIRDFITIGAKIENYL